MNKIILLLIVFCNSFYLKADLVLGMHAKGNQVAFAFKKTIRVVSVTSDSVLFEKELCKDSHIVNLIYQKAKSMAVRDGNENPFLLDNIKDFTTVNLTYFNNDLWIGFRYYAKKQKESVWKYGVIRLGADYTFKNFYLLKLPAQHAFNFPPYFPLEFKDKQTLLMPDVDSGKIVFREFNINEIQNEITLGNVFKKNVQIRPQIQVKYPEGIVFDPTFYSIQGDKYERYFMFPKPVLLKDNKKVVLDMFGLKNQLKTYAAPRFSDGSFLLFNRYISTDTMVLLASFKDKDSLKFLVSVPDKERIWLENYSINQGLFTFDYLKSSSYDTYFIIQERRIITLNLNGKVSKIKIITYR